MYNETLKYIKNNYSNINFKLNFRYIRSQLKNVKNNIINNSSIYTNINASIKKIKNTKIKAHILDDAIHLVCTNYKSAFTLASLKLSLQLRCRTNYKRGNINHFRMRYWSVKIENFYNLKNLRFRRRYNKSTKIMGIEKCYFLKKGMLFTTLGKIESIYNNKEFDFELIKKTYKCDCKLRYKSSSGEYSLFVPLGLRSP